MRLKGWIFSIILLFTFILLNSVGIHCEEIDFCQVRKAIGRFEESLKAGDMDEVAEMYSGRAIILPPNEEIVKGREAIKNFWKHGNYKYFEFISKEVELSGTANIVYQVVNHSVKYQQEGQEPKVWGPGKFVRIWKKQPDGSWKLHIEMWSLNHAQP